MKVAGIALIVISALYFGTVEFSGLRRLGELPLDALMRDKERLDASVEQHDREMTLPEGGSDAIARMEQESRLYGMEMIRRQGRFSLWIPWVGVAGLLLMMASFVRGMGVGRAGSSVQHRSGGYVAEDPPQGVPRRQGD
jgi:hypothetical protein